MPRINASDLDVIFKEAKDDSPRGAAIIMTTALESALEDCICMRLLPYPMSNTHRDTLFGGEAGFAGLSAKIDLGYSLGLYGLKTKSDLHLIRKVRNEFAHYAPRSFAHHEIMKHCRCMTDYSEIESLSNSPNDPPELKVVADEFNMRWRFMHCVNHIAAKLYHEIGSQNYQPPTPKHLP